VVRLDYVIQPTIHWMGRPSMRAFGALWVDSLRVVPLGWAGVGWRGETVMGQRRGVCLGVYWLDGHGIRGIGWREGHLEKLFVLWKKERLFFSRVRFGSWISELMDMIQKYCMIYYQGLKDSIL